MEMHWRNAEMTDTTELHDNAVDLIVMDDPINQSESPTALLDEASRVLKKNGLVHLSILLIENGHNPISNWHYKHKCKKLGARYNLEEIELMIERSGFVISRNTIEEDKSQKMLKLELVKLDSDLLRSAVII